LSASGLKTPSSSLSAADAPLDMYGELLRPNSPDIPAQSKRQPVRNAAQRWCCAKPNVALTLAVHSGVAPDIQTAAELAMSNRLFASWI
jgi:hypothetical protein